VTGLSANLFDVITLAGDAKFEVDALGNMAAGFDGSLSIDGFVSISGDFDFVQTLDGLGNATLLFTGTTVSASLGVDAVAVSITNANFAVLVFEETETFALHAVGDAAVTGLTGDNTFVRVEDVGTSILVTGENVYASLGVAPVELTLSDAEFAMALFSLNGVTSYALHATGTVALDGIPQLTLNGDVEVWVNTTGSTMVTFGDYGTVDYGSEAEIFAFRGGDINFDLGGFASFSGDVGFITESGNIIATARNVSAQIGTGGFEVGIENGSFG
jgi:hypothetical protein